MFWDELPSYLKDTSNIDISYLVQRLEEGESKESNACAGSLARYIKWFGNDFTKTPLNSFDAPLILELHRRINFLRSSPRYTHRTAWERFNKIHEILWEAFDIASDKNARLSTLNPVTPLDAITLNIEAMKSIISNEETCKKEYLSVIIENLEAIVNSTKNSQPIRAFFFGRAELEKSDALPSIPKPLMPFIEEGPYWWYCRSGDELREIFLIDKTLVPNNDFIRKPSKEVAGLNLIRFNTPDMFVKEDKLKIPVLSRTEEEQLLTGKSLASAGKLYMSDETCLAGMYFTLK